MSSQGPLKEVKWQPTAAHQSLHPQGPDSNEAQAPLIAPAALDNTFILYPLADPKAFLKCPDTYPLQESVQQQSFYATLRFCFQLPYYRQLTKSLYAVLQFVVVFFDS